MTVDVGLELLEVVLLHLVHGGHHGAHGVVHVDHAGVAVVLHLAYLGHGPKHGGVILALLKNGQRIGGQRVLLYKGNVGINAVGERQNQCNTDDTNTAREGGHEGAPLFGHQIVEGEGERRDKGHRGALALLDGALANRFLAPKRCLKGQGIIDHTAVAQLDDASGVSLRQLGIVRDHDDQLILGDLLEDLHDLHAGGRVQRTGGLVGKENIGVVDDGAGNGHTLHLTA